MINRWAQVKKSYIEARDIPLYILKKTEVRVTVRQVCRWIRQGAMQQYFPPAYKLTSRKVFTTKKQVDKFLKNAGTATKFKKSLDGYLQVLFKYAQKNKT